MPSTASRNRPHPATPNDQTPAEADRETDYDILRDALVRLLLFPPSGVLPSSSSLSASERAKTLDLDNVDYLLSELRAEGVTITPERDGQLTLDEVEAHPLRSVLAPPLEELFSIPEEGVTWFCSCLIDAYISDLRSLASSSPDDADPDAPGGKTKKPTECELCSRPMPLTAHHLYPRSEHARLLKRTELTKYELQHTIAWLCRPCHSAVHGLIDSATLAREFYSVERLGEHEGVRRWVEWAGRQRVVGRGMRTAR